MEGVVQYAQNTMQVVNMTGLTFLDQILFSVEWDQRVEKTYQIC